MSGMSGHEEDIIAAIATAVGSGAISIVRLSGKGSIELVDKCFSGKTKLSSAVSNTIHYGEIWDKEKNILDTVLVNIFRSPYSYTTEDQVEINCHGGWFVTNIILQTVLECGARLAQPGEFTKRAFLNGRMDLTQAEAVAEMIKARSEMAIKTSIQQLEGKLSEKIVHINTQLIDIVSLFELSLDFVEEKIEIANRAVLQKKLISANEDIQNLVNTYRVGKLCREGATVVIAGRTNVGKSSLLNLLLDEKRAIVTPVPGTTRDIIEENFVINGALFKIIDTAGIRNTNDIVEIEGVKRSYDKITNCDLVLFMIDISFDHFDEDITLIKDIYDLNKNILVAFNKIDLINETERVKILNLPEFIKLKCVSISVINELGIGMLKEQIFQSTFSTEITSDSSILITDERHKQALENSFIHIGYAIESINNNMSGEFISLDIRLAIDSLGTIIGISTTEDMLNNIFSKFCIGK
jgi:tRNA modification GTPase